MKSYFIGETAWERLIELSGGPRHCSHYINQNALDWINQRLVIKDQALIELINARGVKPIDRVVWKACFLNYGRQRRHLLVYDQVDQMLAEWYLAQGGPRRTFQRRVGELAGSALELIMRGWIEDGV